jgi:hypothetical protein
MTANISPRSENREEIPESWHCLTRQSSNFDDVPALVLNDGFVAVGPN